MNNKVLISVVNWNDSKSTNRCVKSLVSQNIKSTIMVIDNSSELEIFKLDNDLARFVIVVKNELNLGFAGAHNQAIDYAEKNEYDYVLIMNNDAYFKGDGCLKKLLGCALLHSADAVSPLIVRGDNESKVWFGGGYLDIEKARTQHLFVDEDVNKVPMESKEVNFLTGCALLLKVGKINRIDGSYFLYWEDADWCASANNKGKRLVFCPTVTVVHNISSSLGSRSPLYAYYNIRNRLIFARKWSGSRFISIFISNSFISVKYVLLTMRYKSTELPKMLLMVLRAQIDGLRGRTGAL